MNGPDTTFGALPLFARPNKNDVVLAPSGATNKRDAKFVPVDYKCAKYMVDAAAESFTATSNV